MAKYVFYLWAYNKNVPTLYFSFLFYVLFFILANTMNLERLHECQEQIHAVKTRVKNYEMLETELAKGNNQVAEKIFSQGYDGLENDIVVILAKASMWMYSPSPYDVVRKHYAMDTYHRWKTLFDAVTSDDLDTVSRYMASDAYKCDYFDRVCALGYAVIYTKKNEGHAVDIYEMLRYNLSEEMQATASKWLKLKNAVLRDDLAAVEELLGDNDTYYHGMYYDVDVAYNIALASDNVSREMRNALNTKRGYFIYTKLHSVFEEFYGVKPYVL